MRSKKQPQRSKKQTQSTNWVFTLNNYTDDEVIKIGGLIFDEKPWDHNSSKVRAVAYAHEVGEKEGTPHLQGFLQLTKKGMSHGAAVFCDVWWERLSSGRHGI